MFSFVLFTEHRFRVYGQSTFSERNLLSVQSRDTNPCFEDLQTLEQALTQRVELTRSNDEITSSQSHVGRSKLVVSTGFDSR